MTLDTLSTWVAAAAVKASQVVTGAGAVSVAYVGLGLPVPATKAYVDSAVKSLTVESLDNRRTVLRLSRFFMGSEEAAIAKTVDGLPDGPNKAILERRRRELQGQLRDIDQDEDETRIRLRKMAAGE